MKKLVLVLLLGLMTLSACQAKVDWFPGDGRIGSNIFPKNFSNLQHDGAWWTNPIVIILLIVVVVLLAVVIVLQIRRPAQ